MSGFESENGRIEKGSEEWNLLMIVFNVHTLTEVQRCTFSLNNGTFFS
jgi:hypothetical protein